VADTEAIMKKLTIALFAAATLAGCADVPVYTRVHVGPAPVAYAPAPVIYAPEPIAYAPAPVFVAPPVIYGSAVVRAPITVAVGHAVPARHNPRDRRWH
jgi:hypothetical protein